MGLRKEDGKTSQEGVAYTLEEATWARNRRAA